MLNCLKFEGWLTVTEVAAIFNISRQAVHKMMSDGVFTNIRYLGSLDKPIYIINKPEVDRVLLSREGSNS
jgi:predicted DNA-binding protein YlxM (UPF0122 family)